MTLSFPPQRRQTTTDGLAALDALKQLRRQLAAEQGVPPYVIFHDATLVEMVRERPGSLEAMLDLSGVGRKKLESYGERFLRALAESSPDQNA